MTGWEYRSGCGAGRGKRRIVGIGQAQYGSKTWKILDGRGELNKAFQQYNFGSIFKTVVSAAALEQPNKL